jgi:hypothetical protein
VTADSAPPQLSPDGYWWWNGQQWVPAAEMLTPAAAIPQHAEPAASYTPAEQYVDPYVAAAPYTPTEQYAVHVPAQQSWGGGAQQLPVFEILPASAAPAPKPNRARTTIAAVVAAVLVVGAGAAYGVGHFLGGGGQQPEDVLPADAAAVVKIDLDPSLSQKTALFRLSRVFPQLHAGSADSIKDDLLRPLFDGESMSYDRDVKPWLGDRAAVAAVPDGSPDGFAPVAAVQFTDKDKAKRTLVVASAEGATRDDPLFFAFSGDYAILAETQADADRYAKAGTHLADNSAYTEAVASLGGDQIAVAWADLKRVYDGLPVAARKANPLLSNVKVSPTGAFVVGAHAASNYLEIQGKAVGVDEGLVQLGASQAGRVRTAGLIGGFPSDTVAALEVTGLGDVVSKAYAALPPPVQNAAKGFGLNLPADLAAIVGTDTAVGALGALSHPTIIARVRTGNPARAVAALNTVATTVGSSAAWCACHGPGARPFVVRPEKGGYTLVSDAQAKTTGTLGKTASFMRAVPDAKSAGMVLYVSVAGLPLEMLPSVGGLDALGMTVNGKTGEFRLRLTTH